MCFISSRNGFKVLGGRNQSPHFLWFFYGKRNNVQNHLYLWVFCTRRTLVHQVHGLRCRGKWANLFPLTWWTVWSGIQHFIYGVLVGSSLSSLEQGCRTLLNTLCSGSSQARGFRWTAGKDCWKGWEHHVLKSDTHLLQKIQENLICNKWPIVFCLTKLLKHSLVKYIGSTVKKVTDVWNYWIWAV